MQTDSPCAVGFPADFIWILLQEAKVLSVHGHGLSSGETGPATTIKTQIVVFGSMTITRMIALLMKLSPFKNGAKVNPDIGRLFTWRPETYLKIDDYYDP